LGAAAPFWIAAVLGVVASAVSLLLQETAPRVVSKSESLRAPSSAKA
jgi:hypothetical protein